MQQSSNIKFTDWLLLISLSQINLVIFALFWTNNTNKVVTLELGVSDLFSQLITRVININAVVVKNKSVINLVSKLFSFLSNWNELNLSWWKPEVPFTSSLFTQDGNESFQRSKDGSMDNNWSCETVLQSTNNVVF